MKRVPPSLAAAIVATPDDMQARRVIVLGASAFFDRLLSGRSPRAILHFATESQVARSLHGPAAFIRTHNEGSFTLPQASRAYWTAFEGDAKAAP